MATVTQGIEVAQHTATDSGLDVDSQRTVPESKGSLLHTKLGMIKKEKSKNSQSYKVESVASSVPTDIHNFSLESKRETEYVSAPSAPGSRSKWVRNKAARCVFVWVLWLKVGCECRPFRCFFFVT